MTLSRIDWVVTWKLHHVQFFWIHLALGIPLRFVAARSFRASTSKTTSSVIVASFVSSVSCTWLPIVPVIMLCAVRSRWGKSRWPVASDQCASSRRYNGYPNRVSRCNAVPYVIETTGFVSLLIANALNASIALALILVWEFHRPTIFLAAADRWR